MIYLWELPEFLSNNSIAVIDRDLSPDQFLFLNGVKLTSEPLKQKIIFDIPLNQSKATKVDCIANNITSPLINQKIIDLLYKLAPDEVQFFDAEIRCKDGVEKNYKLLNATQRFKGIDHEKSICKNMLHSDAILGFRFLTYLQGCMGNLKIARDEEYLPNLLVSEEIKQAFEQAKIKGVRFVRPEDFYRPLRREDIVD